MSSTEGDTTLAADERSDLLAELAAARGFLRYTVRELSDEQVGLHPTASALCLGGLIKHVAQVEERWGRFLVEGPDAVAFDQAVMAERERAFQMQEGETLAGVLDAYEEVARRTDELVRSLPGLDISHPLPPAPWFPPGTRWTARRAVIHNNAETAQHAGHADIIRESLDGAKTMG
jgi:hypothetical protein